MAASGNFGVNNRLIKPVATTTHTNGNTEITSTSGSWNAPLTMAAKTGKWYIEYYCNSVSSGRNIGVVTTDSVKYNQGDYNFPATGTYGINLNSNGTVYNNNESTGTQSGLTVLQTGDVMAMALDFDASPKTVQFYRNGTAVGTVENINTSATGHLAPLMFGHNASTMTLNAGQDSSFGGAKSTGTANAADDNGFGNFYYTPPSGFNAFCTGNLPVDSNIDPAGDDGNTQHGAKHFGVLTWDGDGGTLAITGLGFQPDLVWGFARSGGQSKRMVDSSRGGNSRMYSDANTAEDSTQTTIGFDSDGITAYGGYFNNDSGKTSGAWCWKANGGTTSTNTSGTITSTVQANTIAGFSIITYSGNGTSGATVGHGLGAVPAMTMIKQRNATNAWNVWHQGNNAGDIDSFGELTGSAAWYQNQGSNGPFSSAPTSTALTLTAYGQVNSSTGTYVGYIWSEIEGYSKFSKYTGNGNSDGPFIYTGFRPRLIFFKNTSGTSGWTVVDTNVYPTNTTNGPERVEWNSSSASVTGSSASRNMDILANGVKIRTSNSNVNTNGSTYVFGAWADVPFKYNNTHP